MISFCTVNVNHMITELDVVIVALTSATTIFNIIDRVRFLLFRSSIMITMWLSSQKSLIDACSGEGNIPEKMDGIIRFSNVVFQYPARPNVEVFIL